MGVIESIRNRQTLLLTLIGLGMLSFLVPYDAVIALFGNNPGSQAAGSVNGSDISFLEYRTKVQERKNLFTYTDDNAARNEVWGDILTERLYGDNFDALGLGLTKDEFDDIRYGDYVSPWVSRTFYGGQVTEEQKQNWKQTFSTMFSDPAGKAQYAGYARVISQKRMREKFDGLVKAGLAANTLEGKREFLNNEEKVDFRYVLKRYTTIPDGDVEVDDADVRDRHPVPGLVHAFDAPVGAHFDAPGIGADAGDLLLVDPVRAVPGDTRWVVVGDRCLGTKKLGPPAAQLCNVIFNLSNVAQLPQISFQLFLIAS